MGKVFMLRWQTGSDAPSSSRMLSIRWHTVGTTCHSAEKRLYARSMKILTERPKHAKTEKTLKIGHGLGMPGWACPNPKF